MKVSDRLARMLMTLVSRIAMKSNYRSYSFVADMCSDALFQLIKCNAPGLRGNDTRPNILKFDATYSQRRAERDGTKPVPPNGFSYATQIVTNVFRRHIKMEGALAGFRDDCMVEARLQPSTRRQTEDEMNRSSDPILPKKKKMPCRKRKKPATEPAS